MAGPARHFRPVLQATTNVGWRGTVLP